MSHVIGHRGRARETYPFSPGQFVAPPPPPLAVPTGVDPADVTGNASDSGPGTLAQPLLTVAELNRRINRPLAPGAYPITFLSDVQPGDELLTMDGNLTGSNVVLIFQGTPTQLATGTLTAGTQARDPSTNSPSVVEDTVLGSMAGFCNDRDRILVTSGSNAGLSAVLSLAPDFFGLKSITSLPLFGSSFPGNFAAGDPYEIQRPCNLPTGYLNPNIFGGAILFFDFDMVSPVIQATNISIACVRDRIAGPTNFGFNVDGSGSTGIAINDCAVGRPSSGNMQSTAEFGFEMFGGTWNTSASDTVVNVSLTSTLITSSSSTALTLGPGHVENLAVQVDMEIEDTPTGMTVTGEMDLTQVDATWQLWGSRNGGASQTAVVVEVAAKLVLPGTKPLVTGTIGDWTLVVPGDSRAFDEATGAYGPVASSIPLAETWTNLYTAAPAGFNFSTHVPSKDAHIVTLGSGPGPSVKRSSAVRTVRHLIPDGIEVPAPLPSRALPPPPVETESAAAP